MKFDEFRDEAEGTSRTLGRNFEVCVTFEGASAYTTKTRVNLPMLPDDVELDTEMVRVARGYIDHEAIGHQRHTTLDALGKIFKESEKSGRYAIPKLVNAMEDVRIEPKVIHEYPGARKNLEATVDAVCREFLREYGSDDELWESREAMVPVVITWAGRKLNNYGSEHLDKCIEKIDPMIYLEAEQWAREAMECLDTWAVYELAKKADAAIYSGREKSQSEEGSAGLVSVARLPSVGEVSRVKDERIHDIKDVDPTVVIQRLFDKTIEGARNEGFRSYSTARDVVVTRHGAHFLSGAKGGDPVTQKYVEKINSHTSEHYRRLVQGQRGVISTMRRKLERGLADKVARGRDVGKEFGALDTRRLVQGYSGNPNVYWRPEDVPDLDTAVEMLVDLSGSMSGRKVVTAMQSVVCLSEVLNAINVPFEVTGFSNDGKLNQWLRTDREASGFHRIDNETYFVFKDFKEALRPAMGSLASIASCVIRNNCDGVSVNWAGKRLLKRHESKKVLFVLCDGNPACEIGQNCKPGPVYQHVVDVVCSLIDQGVRVVGIGIKTNAVMQFYPDYVVLNEVADLPGAVMKDVAKMLLGERYEVDNSQLLRSSSRSRRRVA